MIIPAAAAAVIAFLISWLMGFKLIPWLKALKMGQMINDIGPTWHKYKEGTPTMGGVMFIAGTVIASVCGYAILGASDKNYLTGAMSIEWKRLAIGIVYCLALALIGFDDDYHKIMNHQNLGLNAKQKMALQFLVTAAYLAAMHFLAGNDTKIWLPVLGDVDFGLWYYPLIMFSMLGVVNAVNLTDGVDGLAGTAVAVTSAGFAVISSMLGNSGNLIFSVAAAAALIGFLIWNFKPAKVFMGDTGSMFLGGAVVVMSLGCKKELFMLVSGILYVLEAFSVMIQVAYFKATHGKRIFKMTPIHHHFEMSGWSEEKIVFWFSMVSLAGSLVSVLLTAVC